MGDAISYGEVVKVVNAKSFFKGVEGIAIEREIISHIESDEDRPVYKYLVDFGSGIQKWFNEAELEKK